MPSTAIDKDTLRSAVREAVQAAAGRRVSVRKFTADTGIGMRAIRKCYATWSDALRAAGCDPDSRNTLLDSAGLLADWGSVVEKLGRIPTTVEYGTHGKHDCTTLMRHFGVWSNVPNAFHGFAADKAEWKQVLKYLPPPGDMIPVQRSSRKSARRFHDRPACGLPLDFGCLSHAPVNECGVIFLFGMIAGELGFTVEAFQAAFPDCQAKRRIGPAALQNVRIEFEYESRNFRDHRHPSDGCDIIVCWVHNWAECPKNLEVIALSEEIKRLVPSRDAAASVRGAYASRVQFPASPPETRNGA